jgi:hypothetical protein
MRKFHWTPLSQQSVSVHVHVVTPLHVSSISIAVFPPALELFLR